jgi:hypothetical protein
MGRKPQGLRQYDDSVHIFQLPIDKELFLKFKAICILNGITMKDKLAELIELSLGD